MVCEVSAKHTQDVAHRFSRPGNLFLRKQKILKDIVVNTKTIEAVTFFVHKARAFNALRESVSSLFRQLLL